ncbi:MAG: glycosyltransferase family 2 protein [Candidatus Omnitrophota bacterium]
MENEIEVSVVLPCLNEEKTIGVCVNKIRDVFAKEKIIGEIIVADNKSSDRSREIASEAGAKVVVESRRGYGAVYLRGLAETRGKYIIMGDSDDTYNFYDIPKFLNLLREGYDFVLGSRFKGKMKKGAMSWSHRYLGNPVLSGMCRVFFHTRLSDIHCGMRAFTNEAYHKMQLRTPGMEFATEMVVSALSHGLKITEVPIDYFPRAGESKLKPFSDAWRHIRFMLLYCPLWLYVIPGSIGLIFGTGILLLLLPGPFLFLRHYWDMHLLVFASVISILSYQLLSLGIFAHTFAVEREFIKRDKFTIFFGRYFTLERGIMLGLGLFFLGSFVTFFIFVEWFSRHFGALYRIRELILAMTLLVIGLQTIFSSFFISLLFLKRER